MEENAGRFLWMREAMPGVAKLVGEKRRLWGDAHVTDCIQRGLRGEAGCFFAREGAVAVGTPFDTDPALIDLQWRTLSKTQATLIMKNPEVAHGSN